MRAAGIGVQPLLAYTFLTLLQKTRFRSGQFPLQKLMPNRVLACHYSQVCHFGPGTCRQ